MDAIGTPVGDARVDVRPATGRRRCTLVLGHGAGGGIEARDLVALADALPPRGVTVVRVEQPWRVAGRKVATPPATLDRGWLAVLGSPDVTGLGAGGPLVVGGRSAGARVACRTAVALGAAGVLALAFPLHPPGHPERSRLHELDLPSAGGLPVLVVQGTRDVFGGPAEVPAAPGRSVVAVAGGDHAFRVTRARDPEVALAGLVSAVVDWLAAVVGESSSGDGG